MPLIGIKLGFKLFVLKVVYNDNTLRNPRIIVARREAKMTIDDLGKFYNI